MRGFKAKALRKLAKIMEPDSFGTPEYEAKPPGRIIKQTVGLNGEPMPFFITTPIVDQSKGNRLYKRMKKELSRGYR